MYIIRAKGTLKGFHLVSGAALVQFASSVLLIRVVHSVEVARLFIGTLSSIAGQVLLTNGLSALIKYILNNVDYTQIAMMTSICDDDDFHALVCYEDEDEKYFLHVFERSFVVLDNLMAQSGADKRISDIFKQESHRRKLSLVYIVQNIFLQGRETRNITLNAHYIILFKSPRVKRQMSVLVRQVNTRHVQEFMKSYDEATKLPHGYLMLGLKPTSDYQHRLKSNVLPEEDITVQQILDHHTRKYSCEHTPTDDQHRMKSNVLLKENTIGQQNLARYTRKRSYEQPPILLTMYN